LPQSWNLLHQISFLWRWFQCRTFSFENNQSTLWPHADTIQRNQSENNNMMQPLWLYRERVKVSVYSNFHPSTEVHQYSYSVNSVYQTLVVIYKWW
jgi:hypothetical protein